MMSKANLYIVFEIQEEHVLKTGMHFGNFESNPNNYTKVLRPVAVACYEAETGAAACVMAAQFTRRLGNYVATEVTPMSIDFTAREVSSLPSGNDNEYRRIRKGK